MGSFTTACFASGQTIAGGDKAFIMPVLQASGYEPVELKIDDETQSAYGIACMTCYPHCFWEPFGGFIEAAYDDYGRFDLIDTPVNRVRIVHFFLQLLAYPVTVIEGENEYHDVAFDLAAYLKKENPILAAATTGSQLGYNAQAIVKEHADSAEFFTELSATWEYIWDVGAEQRLFAMNDYDQARPLQLSVMHAEAYYRLAAMMTQHKEKVAISVVNLIKEKIAEIVELKEKQGALLAAAESTGNVELIKQISDMIDLRSDLLIGFRVKNEMSRLGSFEGMDYPGEPELLESLMADFIAGNIPEDGLLTALEPILEPRAVMTALNYLNLRLSPQIYSGQDYSNDAGAAYAEFIQEVSAAVTKQRRSDDEDEE